MSYELIVKHAPGNRSVEGLNPSELMLLISHSFDVLMRGVFVFKGSGPV